MLSHIKIFDIHIWKDLKTKWILIIFHRRYYAKIIKKSPSPGHHKNCPLLRCLRWGQCLVTTCQGWASIWLVRSGGCQPLIGWEPHTGIIWTDIKIARPHLLIIGALIWFGPIKGICSEIRINCSEWIQMNCTETRLWTKTLDFQTCTLVSTSGHFKDWLQGHQKSFPFKFFPNN